MGIKTLIAAGLSLALLGGMLIEQQTWPQPADAEPYHESVRQHLGQIPENIGNWHSEEEEVPPSAIQMLRPNELVSRRYYHADTNDDFVFFLIHCSDAHDMIGHYPPICYPASGWTAVDSQERTWEGPEQEWEGMEYSFYYSLPGTSKQITVVNLIVLPDGSFGRNMGDVRDVVSNRRYRPFGAAQAQFVFDDRFTAHDRDEVIAEFMETVSPAIDEIRFGIEQ